MTIRIKLALAAMVMPLSPAAAVQLDTSQLDQHSSIVRQRVLLNQTVGRNRNGSTARRGATARGNRTAQTCANVPAARARLGAGNLKVRKLAQLCRQAGY